MTKAVTSFLGFPFSLFTLALPSFGHDLVLEGFWCNGDEFEPGRTAVNYSIHRHGLPLEWATFVSKPASPVRDG
jgi:hypothetical protein